MLTALQQSLGRMGLRSQLGACSAGSSHRLAVRLDAGCPDRRSSTGMFICAPEILLQLEDCASGATLLQGVLDNKSLRGAGNSQEAARRQLEERIRSKRLDAPLEAWLAATLPTP